MVQLKKITSEKTFVLDRAFSPDKPNLVWVSDITYVRTYEGFLYFATVMDLFSRPIVGWAMDKHIDRHLVINALLMAIWQRQPKEEVLVHSDQGSQYASADYLAFMKEHNLTPSMSRRGNCHDNAVAESFFATIKKRVTKRKIYSTGKKRKQRYLILSRCFTIQSNVILIPVVYHRLNMKKRIVWNQPVSSKGWEVQSLLKACEPIRMIRARSAIALKMAHLRPSALRLRQVLLITMH